MIWTIWSYFKSL